MGLSQKQAEASLYNLKSVVDGMIAALKAGALQLNKCLDVIGASVADIMEKENRGGGPE